MPPRRVLEISSPADTAILRRKAERVGQLDAHARHVIADLMDSFTAQPAYGIAAPQIGELLRVVVVSLESLQPPTQEGDAPQRQTLVLVNPEIVATAGELTDFDGCLSIPNIYADTRRAAAIELHALDQEGAPVQLRLEGFDARIVQHELDHLDGVLFIDRLDSLEDLYTIETREGEDDSEAVPLSAEAMSLIRARRRPLPRRALRWARPKAKKGEG